MVLVATWLSTIQLAVHQNFVEVPSKSLNAGRPITNSLNARIPLRIIRPSVLSEINTRYLELILLSSYILRVNLSPANHDVFSKKYLAPPPCGAPRLAKLACQPFNHLHCAFIIT